MEKFWFLRVSMKITKDCIVWYIYVSISLQCFLLFCTMTIINVSNTYMITAKVSRSEIIKFLPSRKLIPSKICQNLKVHLHEN